MKLPVFDLHCDTALALLDENLSAHADLGSNQLHFDLDRAGEYPGYVQCFACFTSPLQKHPPQRVFETELAVLRRELQRNDARIAQVYSAGDIENNRIKGIISAVLTIEGPAGFDYRPERLPALYDMGFRISTLSWNEANPLTGSHVTGGGLTPLGVAYVSQAQRLGMLIDVSHISDAAFWDIMEITKGPVIASHSNSRAICDVSRNLTDDMFLAICGSGGVAGINMFAQFLGKDPTLDTVCDHIIHFLSLDPSGTHIALGGDLDGCDQLPAGFRGVQDYHKLADRLLERGLQENTVRNIFWNNAVGVMEHCCM